jgi:hypothetical protein
LVVNSKKGPSVSRDRRDRIRAQIHQLDSGSPGFVADARSIRGKIQHVRRFNPGSAARLSRQLDSIPGDISASSAE